MAKEEARTKLVTNLIGHVFFVRTSNEACKKFDIRIGQVVIRKRTGEKGVFIGIAPSENAEEDLWYSFESDNGKVCCAKPWEEIIPQY